MIFIVFTEISNLNYYKSKRKDLFVGSILNHGNCNVSLKYYKMIYNSHFIFPNWWYT